MLWDRFHTFLHIARDKNVKICALSIVWFIDIQTVFCQKCSKILKGRTFLFLHAKQHMLFVLKITAGQFATFALGREWRGGCIGEDETAQVWPAGVQRVDWLIRFKSWKTEMARSKIRTKNWQEKTSCLAVLDEI